MTALQFISAMEKYSVDVLCLGAVVCILTAILKRFLLKGNLKKYTTFAPFATGVGVYAVFMLITKPAEGDAFFSQAISMGIKTGGVATIYYIFYEQFIRGKKIASDPRELAVQGMLEGVISEEKIEVTSKIIVETIISSGEENKEKTVLKVIEENSGVKGDGKAAAVSRLIVATVTKLS